ncbi:MAG: glycogen debranching N-terminal domain-containing protein [Thermoleophilaceae bacterium]
MGEVGFDINDSVVIKEENLFLVSEADGSIPIEGFHPFGLYYNDCRFLSGWELEVMGEQPRLLVCSAASGDSSEHELTNRELTVQRGRRVPPQTLQIRLEREILRGRLLDERIVLNSFDPQPLEVDVRIRLRGGFEPMMWIRGMAPDFRPKRPQARTRGDGMTIAVTGRDGVERSLTTVTRPRPREAAGDRLSWRLRLRRGKPQTIALRHAVSDGESIKKPAPPPLARRRRSRAGTEPAVMTIQSDDQLFDRILERSLADLRLLRSRLRRQRYYAAGIPWYATVFGRDTLITAIEMLAYDRRIAEDTIRLLARNLGTKIDDRRDEEPGKVLHEVRVGELSNLDLVPFARYYGSVDSTPLFLCLLAEHADWSGDLGLFHEMAKPVDAALEWIDRYADLDGDGLLEYRRRSPDGLRNQGWKDSEDGVVDERGRPLDGAIALVEVQGYAMRAKRRLARLFDVAGQSHRADRLREEAIELRERIERFWLPGDHWYAMALDGDKRASRALASNQGHLLWALAVTPERAAQTRDALMSPEMFCGWGIRTLAEGEPGYNPVGYHTGSVWPHDTALAAYGLRKYGFDEDFTRVFEGLLEAASRFPDYRLPELFAGFSRERYEIPVPYPVACHPQAWAAGAIPYLMRTGLGLIADGLEGRLRVIRPSLPRWLGQVEVRGLRVGGATIDMCFERAGDAVTISDVRIDGDVEVVLEISGNRDPEFGL